MRSVRRILFVPLGLLLLAVGSSLEAQDPGVPFSIGGAPFQGTERKWVAYITDRNPRWTLQIRPYVDGSKPAIAVDAQAECLVARSLMREQVAIFGHTTIATPTEIVAL